MPTNVYSPEWFSLFLHGRDRRQAEREVAFIEEHLEPGCRVLDVPCGSGRHARLLAARGYQVVAVDRNASLLGPPITSLAWICADLRALPLVSGLFDAVLCMWQSFGYFDAAGNAQVLRTWADAVRSGGRLILDLYHREFFETHQGERWLQHDRGPIREISRMAGDRLSVELTYPGTGDEERFEWQVFNPEELDALASRCGWRLLLACSDFDAAQAVHSARPRVQYVLEKAREASS